MLCEFSKRAWGVLVVAFFFVSPLGAQAPNGWIQDQNWLLLGPLGNPEGCGPGGVDMLDNWIAPHDIATITPFDEEEIDIDFAAAASSGWEGLFDEPIWFSLESLGFTGGDLVNLLNITADLGLDNLDRMAVLVTYVTYLGAEPIVVDVCSSSDDSSQIWVNRSLIENHSECRPTAGGCSETNPALLLPGKNTIRVLVWQGDGDWSFRLRLQLEDGTVIRDDHPDFEFGFDESGALAFPPPTVSRSAQEPFPGCATEGDFQVTLQGDGSDGADVTLVETVRGPVQVVDITGGGQLTPFGQVEKNPVGIFDDARDVGGPCATGSTIDNGDGSYTVTGGGVDIWQDGDEFHFAYLEATGDFDMTAHVAERQWALGSRWGKAGIMARENLDRSARYSMIQTHGEDLQDSDRFAARPTAGGNNNFEDTPFPTEDPAVAVHRDWMRLERVDDIITGFVSEDGTSWQALGSMEWSDPPATLLLGLAVSAHTDTNGGCDPSTLVFDEIDIVGGDDPKPPGGSANGGTITWDLTRQELNSGVSYAVRGDGTARFSGHDGRNIISGIDEALVATAGPAAGDLGLFEKAHGIGAPCVDGSSVYDSGADSYTITGGGVDIWTDGDQFEYAYRQITGDFSLVAHVAEKQWASGSRWGKVGIMARQDCTNTARYAMVQIHGEDPQDGDRFAGRPTHGGSDNFETALTAGVHKEWLRLDRLENSFHGYFSDDGVNWELIETMNWGSNAPETVLLGLAVCAHTDTNGGCTPTTIVFDNMELSFPEFTMERILDCPPTGTDTRVLLRGQGDPGSPIDIVERIGGEVEVKSISHGGTFEPAPPDNVDPDPVGLWDGTMDIGEPCFPGSTVDNGDGSYTITGGGVDIWTDGDQFHYAYRLATGDFDMIARVANRQWAQGSRWGKVGIMARQNPDPRARYSMVQTHGEDPQDSDRLAGRNSQGAADNWENTPFPTEDAILAVHRDWMRLERVGSLFNGYVSEDGISWELVGTANWGTQPPPTVMLGLAVCPHSDGNAGCDPATLTFDSIDIAGGDGPQEPLASRGGTITWNAVPRADAESGIRYSLEKTVGSSNSVFITGTADGLPIAGPETVPLIDVVNTGELGVFDIAHSVGAPCAIGSSTYDAAEDVYTITGGGIDIWQDGDQFEFAYKRQEGDFSMVAHVRQKDWAPGSRWGKVGIMAREDCTDRSRYSMVQTHGEDPQDGDRFAARPTHGGNDNFETELQPAGSHTEWMRLDRVGSEFIGYFSNDGTDWIEADRQDWGADAPTEVLLGLAVSSHTGGGCAVSTIQFDEVRITSVEGGEVFRRGDVNANGTLDIGDPTNNLSFQFLGFKVPCIDALDYNDDNLVNISDPISNLTHQFLGGPPPADPGKAECGPDPTPDDGLDCAAYPPESCQ